MDLDVAEKLAPSMTREELVTLVLDLIYVIREARVALAWEVPPPGWTVTASSVASS